MKYGSFWTDDKKKVRREEVKAVLYGKEKEHKCIYQRKGENYYRCPVCDNAFFTLHHSYVIKE